MYSLHNFDYLKILFFKLICVLIVPLSAHSQDYLVTKYDNGTVVTAEKLATNVGVQILKEGGNAVDAAVAVHFALAVTYPQAGNIGGGGFMVIHIADSNSTTISLDFRETAPRLATSDMFLDESGNYDRQKARRSIFSSGVPGSVHGMLSALNKYGNLPRNRVLQPAIELAQKGYRLDAYQANLLNEYKMDFQKYDASQHYFTKGDGISYREGDLFVQKDLAGTLKLIKTKGIRGFYSGSTARKIVETMQNYNGLITLDDLYNYQSTYRPPVKTSFKGYTLFMMGPPSSGGITITQMLHMLSSFYLKEYGFLSADYIHLLNGVMKRAYADRNYFLGDPDFIDIPKPTMTDPSYNEERMSDFSWDNTTPSAEIKHGKINQTNESLETTHFSVIDKEGNAVSVTTTLNSLFGNKIAVKGAGFLLNNEMDDFTSKPGTPNQFGLVQGSANKIEPGKRMLSSMTPTIVTRHDSVQMVLGAAGGPRIITTVLQNFLNLSVFEMNAKQSITAPRIHHQWLPDITFTESFAISKDTKKVLLRRGHILKVFNNLAKAHIINVDQGKYTGAADPRGNGNVGGY